MLPVSTGGVYSYGYSCMYQNFGTKVNKFAGSVKYGAGIIIDREPRRNARYIGDRMTKHEFGIFETEPEQDKRYDEYCPEKYGCIAIHDDYIEPLLGKLSLLETYIHTLSRPGNGLVYYGITLIPPSSLPKFKK